MPGPGHPQGCRRPQPHWTGSEPGTTCPEEMGGREEGWRKGGFKEHMFERAVVIEWVAKGSRGEVVDREEERAEKNGKVRGDIE